jgi:hypothetical protein
MVELAQVQSEGLTLKNVIVEILQHVLVVE